MKKKLLAAAVLASLTLSTAAVFAAAPTFSGDANIEYRNQDTRTTDDGENYGYFTNRIRLNVESQIDDTFYIHGRARMDNNLRDGGQTTTTSFDQAYIGAKFDQVDLKVGRQSLAIGKGLLMDDDKFTGAQVGIALDGTKLNGFTGRDANDDKTHFADVSTAMGDVNLGASFLKEADNKYYGINADTKLADNVVLNVEYAKNNTLKADGYLAEIAVGQAAQKGDFKYAVSYRDIDAGALPDFTTDGWYKDSKGFRVKGIYKVSDAATLTAYQDIAEENNGSKADHNRTNVEFAVSF
ncbi:hypothetical protein [Sporomusa aerivorans]|uniref:hypothetical protein n=1 Tax=Sporomusa aerivorans TaxID=204936 RepID=UPI00352A305F